MQSPQITAEDVARIDTDDAVDAMTKQLTGAFPQAFPQPHSEFQCD